MDDIDLHIKYEKETGESVHTPKGDYKLFSVRYVFWLERNLLTALKKEEKNVTQ